MKIFNGKGLSVIGKLIIVGGVAGGCIGLYGSPPAQAEDVPTAPMQLAPATVPDPMAGMMPPIAPPINPSAPMVPSSEQMMASPAPMAPPVGAAAAAPNNAKKQDGKKGQAAKVEEANIRALLEDWASAVRAKDSERVMSHYIPDILLFDLVPPLQYRGVDAYRKSLQEWFLTFQGPVGYEIRDVSITTGDGVAFSHSLNRISGRRTNGEETDVWVRATVCYRKINSTWMVAHEHVSVPFYMDGSVRAAVDLKP